MSDGFSVKVTKILQGLASHELTAFLSDFDLLVDSRKWLLFLYIYWDSLHARLNSHFEAWIYKKKKQKKIRAYRKSV